jgi:hypothetical protein
LLNKLALSKGIISVASYNAGHTLTFTATPTLEGQGSYRLQQTGVAAFQSLSASLTMTAPAGAVQTFSLPDSSFVSGVQSGKVIGTLTLTNPSNYYDVAHLIIANESKVMAALDISTALSAVGQYAIDLPSGSTTSNIASATYYAYLRIAKSTVDANPVWIPIQTVIDLRNATRTRLDMTKTLTAPTTTTTP